MVDTDFRRQIAGRAQGAAIKFTDIDGIGPATAEKIKNAEYGINAPRDIADYKAEELAEMAGISTKRARKAIKGGGGNPNIDQRNTGGTVSAGNLADAMDSSREKAAEQVQEKRDIFSQLVEAGDEIPDRRGPKRGDNPFLDADPDTVRQVGQAADIFNEATSDPIDVTQEKPDLGFDEEDRENASRVRIAALESLEQSQGLEYDEASKQTRGSPSNPPEFGQVTSVLPSAGPSILTVGEFEVSEEGTETAREAHQSRSDNARRVDKRRRATITTNADKYAQAPGQYDYPGVDTPSSDPRVLTKDLMQEEQPETADVEDDELQQDDRPATGFAVQEGPSTDREQQQSFMGELEERDVSLSPEEAFEGAYTDSQVSGMTMGPMFNANKGRPVETDRPEREQEPPERVLRQQQRQQPKGLAGDDSPGAAIAFVYRNEGQETDMSLGEFRRRTKRVGRKLGLDDAFGNAMMVADDAEINRKI